MLRAVLVFPLMGLMLLANALTARAAMEIQVIGGAANKIALAMVPFRAAPGQPQPSLTQIAGDDLNRSGQIRLVDTSGVPTPFEPAQVNYATWRGKGAEALVIGQVSALPGGRFEVRFRVLDAVKQTQLAGFSYNIAPEQWRATAHQIADIVYEKLTGTKGAFSSRIAYVQKQGKKFELRVADADGQNPRTVVRSGEPLISPMFSPDGARVVYVSFEDRKPVVYVQSLADGSRRKVAAFKGSNSAPAWSPDGRRLAVVLTRDAASQIYLINADGSGLKRLTEGGNIDTEPVFSPDGQTVYFTSDRGGSPQIYKVPANGGEARRVTFSGSYNVSPAVSPDGRLLAFISRDEGRFRVALLELATGQTRMLTDTARDESPAFAPNGQSVLYATVQGGRGVLGTVSLDGRTRSRLSESGVDAREPAWGP
ncbi:MAG: Tol-Pal system beta propeller repeat protein TolB [Hydrogenophilales bacterium 16-64-46]|nr:MAG: Tol-Pal system beta propeller repeat protein TolB [Hydrogenophilales bacterium 12-64-13]OYZ04418.1 MAG: Tol-Pal system beta propeller repeat protein TolB [Hydrogenophilales bacterium 16-64-46]OZA38218.1 MAG: Tol-Pal system beta propeller repeat protein TolB [Hydrogenophilales bacterium 17-64-34]HQS99121.1 Tol-Pal system beta propeller repeat protein TolB [Thiobacillus sp.]